MKKKILLLSIGLVIVYLIVLFLSKYPTYNAKVKTPPGFYYSGHAAWFDPWDLNVYLSSIRSGQYNGILLKNRYTTDKNKPILIYSVYTLTGYLFKNINVLLLYNMLTVVTTFLLVVDLFVCCYTILKDYRWALLGALFASLSRGLGWLLIDRFESPDLFMSSFSLRSAYQRPHEAIALIIYITSFTLLYLFFKSQKAKYAVASLLINICLLFFYPYYFLIYILQFTVLNILMQKDIQSKWKLLIISVCVEALLAFGYFIYLYGSGFASEIAEKLPSITIAQMFVGYGFNIPIFLFTIFTIRNIKKHFNIVFLALWIIIAIATSYLPIGFARFFLRGLYFPFAVITCIFIRDSLYSKKLKPVVILAIIAIYFFSTFPTAVYIFNKRMKEAELNNPWYYFPIEYFNAFTFLDNQREDGILSDYWAGNHIPVYTNKTVYFGHLTQTPQANDKIKNMLVFFSGKGDEVATKKFLKNAGINYIFYGLQEQSRGKISYSFLQPVYSNSKVTIYKVKI